MGRIASFFLVQIALAFALASPARADDISATARSVVRVVVIAVDGEEVVGFGHGSGFAVAGNRVVTNAHVVALAAEHPENVAVGVVPSEGSKSFGARLVAYDAARDLALLELTEGSLPPASLYMGPFAEGGDVVALGYPGNVDLATAQSADDYITPQAPTRSAGNYSNERQVDGIRALLHTANIARGNSGGPLLDPCGRIVGVNTFITRGEEGDAPFGFAISNSEVATFLRAAKQNFSAVSSPCVSMEDRLNAERSREEQEKARAEALETRAKDKADQEALARAQAENEDARENRAAIAIVLGVLSLAAFGGAGLMAWKDKTRPAMMFAGGGALLLIGATFAFLSRPSRDDLHIQPDAAVKTSDAKAGISEATGKSVCKLVENRSRVTVSSTENVNLDWAPGGCMNGRTQYARAGDVWRRVLVPNGDATVSVLEYRPARSEYVVTRYLMSQEAMAEARRLREGINIKACSADEEQLAILGDRQDTIRASLPNLPNERLVYQCGPAD
ncbi:trypsin-like peptidase domain-containing protein [Sphingosinicella sp. BN140058]|uniref:trypsin-like peptidase domain-containing protein n=1 Tax=Sphingosinicella sp. BN140058 TaxID=1892855 RepID=UPI001012EAEC|nr:trypsin-like peptidase domain-containing protein [Sphingosinicella sp. BN140058]QAY75514.1 trypsin-like serine protease [Sphingosinicella sp. BN140058]